MTWNPAYTPYIMLYNYLFVPHRLPLVSGPQTAFRLTHAQITETSPLQKSDMKKERGKGSEDLRLACPIGVHTA